MVTAGLDIGTRTIKVVLLREGREMVGRVIRPLGSRVREDLAEAWQELAAGTGTGPEEIEALAVTGSGKGEAQPSARRVTEVGADARGAAFLCPPARTVIDLGAEEGRVIRIDKKGRVVDFTINDRCAAGAGVFMETAARTLEVSLEELGSLSLCSTREVALNAQCVVFAESELVGLIHSRTPRPDIARAIHRAVAQRTAAMVQGLGVEEKVVLIGGMAGNVGIVDCLEKELRTEVLVPEGFRWAGALGAALLAAQGR